MTTPTNGRAGVPAGRARPRRSPGAGRFHSWRVAVRIARRDAWRAKGRSLMVLAMIAIPVVGVSAADVTIRSSQLTPQQTITRDIGAADARLEDGGQGPQALQQSPKVDALMPARQTDTGTEPAASGVTTPQDVDPKAALPAGSRFITDQTVRARILTKSGMTDTEVRELNAADPLAAGITDLTRGRYATAPDEMIATNAFLEHSGLHVGSAVRAFGLNRAYRIVGAYDLPSKLGTDQLGALPGTFIGRYRAAREATGSDAGDTQRPSYLVEVAGGFTWDMVRSANARGVVVHSRMVMLRPPADSEVPLYRNPGFHRLPPSADHAALTAGATIGGMALLEVCLLAGPAFAVGARRSRRQLGLVGANGGDRRHIRAIVVSGGLVIGGVAAVTGTVLGLVLTLVLRARLEEYAGSRFGGIVLRPAELVGAAALAMLTGLIAAIVPAVNASRQNVLSALTGRPGTRKATRLLPAAGVVAVCLGAMIAVYGSVHSGSAYIVAGGSAIAELGLVALTPLIVGGFGRLGRWLALAPRLALRDAVRHRSRTAPAVAAVLAAVAGTVAIATYSASQHQQDQDAYIARAPRGVLAVSLPSRQGRDLDAVRDSVEKIVPVRERADVFRLSVADRICDAYSPQPGCGSVEPVRPTVNVCPTTDPDAVRRLSPSQVQALADDWRCKGDPTTPALVPEQGILIGGPTVLRALGVEDPAAREALAHGKAVLFDRTLNSHGSLRLRVTPDQSKTANTVKALPAQVSSAQAYGVKVLMSQRAAESLGLKAVPLGTYFTTSRMPSGSQQQELKHDVAKLGIDAHVYLERGYTSKNSLIQTALAVFAGLVTIGAAGVATGLAQADAEADLRTLAAVGAPSRIRRTLSGLQCGAIAMMGVVLGTAAGILPAVALRRIDRQQALAIARQAAIDSPGALHVDVPVVVPWTTLGMLLVLVPLGATLLAALITRSHRTLGRRAEA
ncbi:FtsX-like permease family protein [Streptomyces sp. NPDC048448]|uniref:ABC transporter permease n=1 Tax=unclassified Streptomyces TaxID=2593676 RepID=UPI003415FD5E